MPRLFITYLLENFWITLKVSRKGRSDPPAFLGKTVHGIKSKKKSPCFQNLYGVNMRNISKSEETW